MEDEADAAGIALTSSTSTCLQGMEISTGEISMACETWWVWGSPSSSEAPARPIMRASRKLPLRQPLEVHEKRWVRCVAQ